MIWFDLPKPMDFALSISEGSTWVLAACHLGIIQKFYLFWWLNCFLLQGCHVSGKSQGKTKFSPGQGIVREF